MPESILWQLGELLDKTVDVVPCDIIVANPRTPSSQDESFSVRNSASIPAIMFQRKGEATWNCLCSQLCFGTSAAQQHNCVRKRGRCPCRVSRSR